jgi:two-component system vancomycin resistance associated response regulator VraR
MKLKIILMDGYAIALEGLQERLKKIPEFEITGAFSVQREMLQHLENKPADIIIVDFMLRGGNDLELVKNIQSKQKEIKIIALVAAPLEQILYEKALEMGVKAFLSSETTFDELVSCIKSVGKGNDVIPDFLVKDKTSKLLSEVETKVMDLIVREYTNERIAKELFISKRTVETHVRNICRKLGVDGRVGIVREAFRLNLL